MLYTVAKCHSQILHSKLTKGAILVVRDKMVFLANSEKNGTLSMDLFIYFAVLAIAVTQPVLGAILILVFTGLVNYFNFNFIM